MHIGMVSDIIRPFFSKEQKKKKVTMEQVAFGVNFRMERVCVFFS